MDKQQLFQAGVDRARSFLDLNSLVQPQFVDVSGHRRMRNPGDYGFYRNGKVHVNVKRTRPPTKTPGFSWVYPGYKADLTAYGVVAHEVGHHVDGLLKFTSDHQHWLEIVADEAPVTSYDYAHMAEAFAEAIKLFITNPDLLRVGRPQRYEFLTTTCGLRPLNLTPWDVVLSDAHPKFHAAARTWIAKGGRA